MAKKKNRQQPKRPTQASSTNKVTARSTGGAGGVTGGAAATSRTSGSKPKAAGTAPAPPVGLIIGVCLTAVAIVVVLIIFVFGGGEDEPLVAQGSASSLPAGAGVVVTEGEDLPQVIVQADYSCGGCYVFEPVGGAAILAAAEADEIALTIRQLSFVDSGREGGSALAANAAQCSDDQGVFPEYHHLLYDWGGEDRAPERTDEQLLGLAVRAGLAEGSAEYQEFAQCVADGSYLDYVQDQQELASRENRVSTPQVYINGNELSAAERDELASVSGALDRLLAENQ